MPELPEVETIRRNLDPLLRGRTVERVRIRRRDIVMNLPSGAALKRRLEGRTIRAVQRRGKNLFFRLQDGPVLQVQVRMTGRFALGERRPDPAEYRHIVATFALDDGNTLFYDDVRRLGGFFWLTAEEHVGIDRSLGPEPLDRRFTAVALGGRLAGSRAPIKNALLDQRRLAGLGNIYASEVLFRARLSPGRPAGTLSADELKALHRAIRAVLRDALAAAGTTFRDYRAVNGRSGRFQERLRVYARDGQPCHHCGAPILRFVQAGRSTFYCPACQS